MSSRLFLLASLLIHSLAAQPLWPGSRFSETDRAQAIRRGLRFISSTAQDPKAFYRYGTDFLLCFYSLSEAGADPEFKAESRRLGHELALRWRSMFPRLPAGSSALDVFDYASGSNLADLLGVPGPAMRRDVERVWKHFHPEDFFGFNPAKEPIPSDIPERCSRCGARSSRGMTVCLRCGEKLAMKNPYDVLFDALVTAYFGDLAHMRLGGTLADVTQWIPMLRPYRLTGELDDNFYSVAYTITHIIYTLNSYSLYRLKPEWLPQEFDFLNTHFRDVYDSKDGETLGEFIDSLKAFGLPESDPLLQKGLEYLLDTQNKDGSWGDPAEKDIYTRYHATWTGIGAVMSYAWRGERPSSSAALKHMRQTVGRAILPAAGF